MAEKFTDMKLSEFSSDADLIEQAEDGNVKAMLSPIRGWLPYGLAVTPYIYPTLNRDGTVSRGRVW